MTPADFPSMRFDAGARSRYLERLRTGWTRVHVDTVNVVFGPGGARARAVIGLGGLTPADVQVELIPVRAPDVETVPDAPDCRMWSSQSYDNGSFVFEKAFAP